MSVSPVTPGTSSSVPQKKVQSSPKKVLSLAQITKAATPSDPNRKPLSLSQITSTTREAASKKMVSDNVLGKASKTISRASGEILKKEMMEIKKETKKTDSLGRKFLTSVSDSLLNRFRANKVREEVKTNEPIYKGLATYIATTDKEKLCDSSCLNAVEQDVRDLQEKCFISLRKLFISASFRMDLQQIVNQLNSNTSNSKKEKIGGKLFILIWANSFGSFPPTELARIKMDILKLFPEEKGFSKSGLKKRDFEELALDKDKELRFAFFAFSHLILPLFTKFIDAEIGANQNKTAPAIKEVLACLSETLPKIDEMPAIY